jgi:LysM repeat protein
MMNYRFFKATVCLLLLNVMGLQLHAQTQKKNPDAENYIETYKYFAIGEMHRSGIPASITLAQGILESNSGKSPLAQYANNHFGIKCQTVWQGETYYQTDDAENECFRKYNSVAESFIDHSEFLRSRSRYSALFQLSANDYEAWAFGLKQAGYATNPQYAEILISKVTLYDLNKYDQVTPKKLQAMRDETKENFDYDDRIINFETVKNANIIGGKHQENYFNGIRTVVFRNGDTLESIAKEMAMNLKRLQKYNEYDGTQKFVAGDRVYLQPKKKKLPVYFHKVKANESLWDIAQKYGLQLKRIVALNQLPKNAEVMTGEMINLHDKRATTPKLRTKTEMNTAKNAAEAISEVIADEPKPEPIIDNTPKQTNQGTTNQGGTTTQTTVVTSPKQTTTPTPPTNTPPKQTTTPDPVAITPTPTQPTTPKQTATPTPPTPADPSAVNLNAKTHTVVKGDTMYNISKRYILSVEKIRQYNNMTDNNIKLGQVLKLKP